jgi:hypothetical protein
VQEQRCEGNDERQDRRPAFEQPRVRALTPLARGRTHEDNRHTSEGANVDANGNTNDDTPPIFRRASQNLAVAAMLLRGCPEVATSKERRVFQELKALLKAAAAQQAESSASHQWSARDRGAAPSVHRQDPSPP